MRNHYHLVVKTPRLLGEHGQPQDTIAAGLEFERRMEAWRVEPGDEPSRNALRRGWCLGSEDFRKRMLEETEGLLGETILEKCTGKRPKPRPSASSKKS